MQKSPSAALVLITVLLSAPSPTRATPSSAPYQAPPEGPVEEFRPEAEYGAWLNELSPEQLEIALQDTIDVRQAFEDLIGKATLITRKAWLELAHETFDSLAQEALPLRTLTQYAIRRTLYLDNMIRLKQQEMSAAQQQSLRFQLYLDSVRTVLGSTVLDEEAFRKGGAPLPFQGFGFEYQGLTQRLSQQIVSNDLQRDFLLIGLRWLTVDLSHSKDASRLGIVIAQLQRQLDLFDETQSAAISQSQRLRLIARRVREQVLGPSVSSAPKLAKENSKKPSLGIMSPRGFSALSVGGFVSYSRVRAQRPSPEDLHMTENSAQVGLSAWTYTFLVRNHFHLAARAIFNGGAGVRVTQYGKNPRRAPRHTDAEISRNFLIDGTLAYTPISATACQFYVGGYLKFDKSVSADRHIDRAVFAPELGVICDAEKVIVATGVRAGGGFSHFSDKNGWDAPLIPVLRMTNRDFYIDLSSQHDLSRMGASSKPNLSRNLSLLATGGAVIPDTRIALSAEVRHEFDPRRSEQDPAAPREMSWVRSNTTVVLSIGLGVPFGF